MQIAAHPSPNFGDRRGGVTAPDLIVLHYTAMQSAEAALERLCDPEAEVSAHYLIARDGQITRLVEEGKRAWHAGAGCWRAADDINSRSIGIELDNDGTSPFSAPLMDALDWLLPQIMQRWSIPASGVIGHSDLAPDRKIDPGPRFDWRRLALQGYALWPEGSDQDVPLEESLAALGYAVDQFGIDPCLAAFRARFAPQCNGVETAQDRRRAAALAQQIQLDGSAPSA